MMNKLFSPSFWVQLFLNTFLTMVVIYLIKTVAGKYQIPVVSDVASAV